MKTSTKIFTGVGSVLALFGLGATWYCANIYKEYGRSSLEDPIALKNGATLSVSAKEGKKFLVYASKGAVDAQQSECDCEIEKTADGTVNLVEGGLKSYVSMTEKSVDGGKTFRKEVVSGLFIERNEARNETFFRGPHENKKYMHVLDLKTRARSDLVITEKDSGETTTETEHMTFVQSKKMDDILNSAPYELAGACKQNADRYNQTLPKRLIALNVGRLLSIFGLGSR
jgi:hypothetical protein